MYMYEFSHRALDIVHSNLQHNFLNNIELIKFFSKKNISIYSTQHGQSKYVKIFERLYLNIRILAILSEMRTEYGVKTVLILQNSLLYIIFIHTVKRHNVIHIFELL